MDATDSWNGKHGKHGRAVSNAWAISMSTRFIAAIRIVTTFISAKRLFMTLKIWPKN
jgi:hypothetical protein